MEHVKEIVKRELNQAERYLEQEKRHKEHLEGELEQTNTNIAQSEKRIAEMKEFLNPQPVAQQLVANITVNAEDLAKEVVKKLHGARIIKGNGLY